MNFKIAWTYFGALTVILIVLFGFMAWHGNDTEYRYYTAVRMHACDILRNDHSTFPTFEPDRCEVKRRNVLLGELIDVTCRATDENGDEQRFSHSYSDGHLIFRYVLDRTYAFRHGGYCHG